MLLVHLLVLGVCPFSLPLGVERCLRFVVCDCGIPRTFLLTFLKQYRITIDGMTLIPHIVSDGNV